MATIITEQEVQQEIKQAQSRLQKSVTGKQIMKVQADYKKLILAMTKKLGLEQLKIQAELKKANTAESQRLAQEEDQLIKDYHTTIVAVADELDNILDSKE